MVLGGLGRCICPAGSGYLGDRSETVDLDTNAGFRKPLASRRNTEMHFLIWPSISPSFLKESSSPPPTPHPGDNERSIPPVLVPQSRPFSIKSGLSVFTKCKNILFRVGDIQLLGRNWVKLVRLS